MRLLSGKVPLTALLAAGLVAAYGMAGPRAGAADRVLRSGIVTSGFDAKVRPQDDLFRHVNGGWIAEAKIPAEYGYFGNLMELRDKALADLRAIIEDAAKQEDESSGSEARQIGDLYGSFMDEKKAEELGLEPIRGELARVDAVPDKAGFLRLMAELQRQGAGGLFRLFVIPDAKQSDREIVYLSQGGISLPDESFYRDPKFRPIREAFVAHVQKMFTLAGRPGPAAAAKQVMDLETRLAKSHWDRVKSRDQTLTYNKKDRAALDALTPGFDWATYFDVTGARDLHEVVVWQPDFFTAMAAAYKDVPLDQWKTWLAWHVIHEAAPYLNKAIVDEDFDFERRLTGATELPPRWKRGVKVVEGALGEAAGKLYVARHFPPEAKARMQQLVKNLIEAYRRDIQDLDWMSPETKKKALEKLAKFTPKIGYPDKWRDYSKLDIRKGDLLGNIRRADAFELDRDLAKLGKPVDRSEWGMTPQTVNAYYNPLFNEIVFPAAILQPPIFNRDADDAVNYGGICAVIGHEIGHGFDDQGSKYDGDGNMKNWWTDSDRKEFEKRAKMLIEQYNGFSPAQLPGQHVNGALTIGENIGDLGGLAIAFKAYKLSLGGTEAPVLDGRTGDQRFFLGWAQCWRAKYRDAELMRRLATDPHSPAEFRCNGVVRNLPEFYAAFGVKEGDKLWLSPDRRVRIW
jgi:putative endopeptidase